jgi:hypothetical protein
MSEMLRGRGTLILLNSMYNVDYELSGDSGRVIGLSTGDVDLVVTDEDPVRLILEDHRSVRIVVENEEGDFRVIGSIETAGKW